LRCLQRFIILWKGRFFGGEITLNTEGDDGEADDLGADDTTRCDDTFGDDGEADDRGAD
jgi:hypothetical protein